MYLLLTANFDLVLWTPYLLLYYCLVAMLIWKLSTRPIIINSTKSFPQNLKDDDPISDTILRALKSRRGYYNGVYLKSNAWKRKRYIVLKRDNWRCVRCGGPATQVHHKRYAPKNIGKEPMEWLESVCRSCHESLHH